MKSVYLISYVLRNPESIASKKAIDESIKSVSGFWWHHLKGMWLVAADNSSAQSIYDMISPLFKLVGSKPEDSVLVIKIDPSDKQGFLPKKAWEWISKQSGEQT
jgi:hypothetical protein